MQIRRIRTLAPGARTAPRRHDTLPPHRQITYTAVAKNRGKPRLWLEGLRLNACGFTPGTPFRVDLDLARRQVRLIIDPNGDRTVAQRRRSLSSGGNSVTPIIDVTGGALAEVLGAEARVRATLAMGEIFFDLHPVELAIERRESRTRQQLEQGFLTEGTLCAGAGVSTLALHEGIEAEGLDSRVEWIIDRDYRYLQVAADNNPAVTEHTLLYEASLEEVESTVLSPVSICSLSLPCTGHSRAGKAKRKLQHAEEHPTDGLAVYGALKILDAVNASAVVSENVTLAKGSASYAILMAYLEAQGYELFEAVLDGEQAGTVEDRSRWWLIAISRGFAAGFDVESIPAMPRVHATLGDALEPIPDDDDRWKAYDYLVAKAVRDAAEGRNFKRNLVTPDMKQIGCISRGYSRVRTTDPALCRPQDEKTRLLTPVEHARVKGIPESLVRDVPTSTGHEVLGQSILFGHAVGIGRAIAAHLKVAVPARSARSPASQGELALRSQDYEESAYEAGVCP